MSYSITLLDTSGQFVTATQGSHDYIEFSLPHIRCSIIRKSCYEILAGSLKSFGVSSSADYSYTLDHHAINIVRTWLLQDTAPSTQDLEKNPRRLRYRAACVKENKKRVALFNRYVLAPLAKDVDLRNHGTSECYKTVCADVTSLITCVPEDMTPLLWRIRNEILTLVGKVRSLVYYKEFSRNLEKANLLHYALPPLH